MSEPELFPAADLEARKPFAMPRFLPGIKGFIMVTFRSWCGSSWWAVEPKIFTDAATLRAYREKLPKSVVAYRLFRITKTAEKQVSF